MSPAPDPVRVLRVDQLVTSTQAQARALAIRFIGSVEDATPDQLAVATEVLDNGLLAITVYQMLVDLHAAFKRVDGGTDAVENIFLAALLRVAAERKETN